MIDHTAGFGQLLKRYRMALGLTQEALAERVGCATQTIRKIEADQRRPSFHMAERLAQMLDIPSADHTAFINLARRSTVAPPELLSGATSTDAPAATLAVATPEQSATWFPRTKLAAPRLRADLLARPRLNAPMQAALAQVRLILVAAPAGAGKTTLLTATLADLPYPKAWIALDADDNDLVRFLTVFHAACEQLAPTDASLAAKLRQTLAVPGTNPLVQAHAAMALLVNRLLEGLTTPAVLVLDDLHEIEAPAIYEALAYLIDHLPTQLTLAIATRHDPPLPLARLRARRELLEIRLPELRFTAAETAALLTEQLGLPLSSGEVEALHQRTEGWAAGLSLLAVSLAPLGSQHERADFLAHLAQNDRYLFDYLAEEVLDRQDASTRDFLISSAILSELTPASAAALTGRTDAAALLETLYRRNLFLVQIRAATEREEAAYRYHDLFRVFLLTRLRRDAPDRLRELHRSAAAATVDPIRAAVHLLQAEAWEAAATRIEALGETLEARGAFHMLQTLIEALPEPLRTERPRLRYLLGLCARQRWDTTAIDLLAGAAAAAGQAGQTIAQGEALAALATTLALMGELGRAADTAAQALMLPLTPANRVHLLAGRAWQRLIGGGWRLAVADFDEALTIAETSRDPQVVLALTTTLRGSMLGLPGGIARVERLNRLVMSHTTPDAIVPRATTGAMRAWAAIWRDEWELAASEGEQVIEGCPSITAFSNILAEIYTQQTVCSALTGPPERAEQQITRLLAALEPDGPLSRIGRLVALLYTAGRVRWLQGRISDLHVIYQRIQTAAQQSVWPTDAFVCREVGAWIDLAAGRTDPAIRELHSVAEDTARLAVASVLGDPRLHLAHAYLVAERPDEALAAATPAFAAIEREGAPGRLRWQGPQIVVPLLRLCTSGPQAAFAATMVARLRTRG